MELRSGRRLRATNQIGLVSAMELRSGRRLGSTQQVVRNRRHGPDHISALPDDLLLLILARLRCAATAARTGVLSRRWRDGLWTRLREIVLRGVKFHNLEPALTRVSPPVSVLEIHVSGGDWPESKNHVNSLLRAAARLDPQELVFALPNIANTPGQVALPCFRRATSIVLDSPYLDLHYVPDVVELPALETLSISAYSVNLEGILSGCTRLRQLKLNVSNYHILTLRSGSLQELVVDTKKVMSRVEIAVPKLKQLTLSTRSNMDINISILAPLVEKVSWQCRYTSGVIALGPWCLDKLRLHTDAAEPHGEVSSLHIHASMCPPILRDREYNLIPEVEKHMVAAFSTLELHLATSGHGFGALVFHVIGIKRIRTNMQRLKVVLQGSTMKEECPTNCSCDPADWKTQNVSLIALEEMEIDGFKGEDHEYDFLKLVFKSAVMLKRVVVKLSHEDSSSNHGSTELYDFFRMYSSVECCVYLSTG